jgi:hypothetical protein
MKGKKELNIKQGRATSTLFFFLSYKVTPNVLRRK